MFGLFRRKQDQARSQTWDVWRNPPFFGYGKTSAGVTVTAENPISHHAVFSCVNVIAEGVAMLPLMLYRERGPNRREAIDHPLYDLLMASPNPRMTAFQFWKLAIFEKLHYGNHYSLVDRDPATGAVLGLYPIENGRCIPFWYRDPATGRFARAYRVSSMVGAQAVFLEDEIFHLQYQPLLRGMDYGLRGVSVWQAYQAETIGGALGTEESANASLGNGVTMPGFIATDAPLTAEVSKSIKDQIKEEYSGAANAGKIGVFGSGAKFQRMGASPEELQQLESRKFNRSVIAGILRVTAHLLNDLEKGTFSNVEHLDIGHYKHCLFPHLTDLCQTASKDLLLPGERREMYFEHDPQVMLLGDQKTLGEMLEKAVNAARMTPNEARALNNRPPLPGGDELYINAAAVPLRMAADGWAQKSAREAGAASTSKRSEGGDHGDAE